MSIRSTEGYVAAFP